MTESLVFHVEELTDIDGWRWARIATFWTKDDAVRHMEEVVCEDHKMLRVVKDITVRTRTVEAKAAYMGRTDAEVVAAVKEGRMNA